MDKKTVFAVASGAIVTGIISVLIGWSAGAFESRVAANDAGREALTDKHIEDIVKQIMVTDTGVTYAANLAALNIHVASTDTAVNDIKGEVGRLSNAVTALSTD